MLNPVLRASALWGLAITLSACSFVQSWPLIGQPLPDGASYAQMARDITSTLMLAPASAEEFSQRCDKATALVGSMAEELANREGPAGRSDLVAFDAMLRVLDGIGGGEAAVIAEANPDPAIRAAADQCQQQTSDLSSRISLSRPVFERLQAVSGEELSERDIYVRDRVLREFRRAGVDRSQAVRERIDALNAELTELSLRLGKVLRESQSRLELESVEDLRGLPADFIKAHAPDANGKIVITSAYPDVFPILNYAESAEVRRQVLKMYRQRAYPESEPVLRSLLEKRHEYAQLLGYKNWAEYALANKMTGTPERAQAFLDQLEVAAGPAAQVDYARLLEVLRREDPAAEVVPEWSAGFIEQQLKQRDYALNAQEVREYFAYNSVRDGIVGLIQDLFQVEIRDWADAPIWEASVTAHELYQGDKLLGRFFLDMHPRPGKFTHAAAFPVRLGPTSDGPPVAVLLCNFPQGGHATGLMEHNQVETFLHEFGHLIHMMFAAQPDYESLAMHNLEWDFIEAPSQMLEEWVWDYDTLARFARNAKGRVIPRELVAKMNAAREFGLGMGTLRQLALANVSLNYYNRSPEEVNFKLMWDDYADRFSQLERIPDTHPYASFGHLDGYSAFYYTYQWSLAIATDMFSQFKAHGLRDPGVSQRYRETVLAPGSTASASTLVNRFLGRDWSVDAYEELLNEAAKPVPVLH